MITGDLEMPNYLGYMTPQPLGLIQPQAPTLGSLLDLNQKILASRGQMELGELMAQGSMDYGQLGQAMNKAAGPVEGFRVYDPSERAYKEALANRMAQKATGDTGTNKLSPDMLRRGALNVTSARNQDEWTLGRNAAISLDPRFSELIPEEFNEPNQRRMLTVAEGTYAANREGRAQEGFEVQQTINQQKSSQQTLDALAQSQTPEAWSANLAELQSKNPEQASQLSPVFTMEGKQKAQAMASGWKSTIAGQREEAVLALQGIQRNRALLDLSNQIADRINKETDNARQANYKIGQMRQVIGNNESLSGQVALAAVRNFMLAMEPNSAVMGGEYESVLNSAPLLASLFAKFGINNSEAANDPQGAAAKIDSASNDVNFLSRLVLDRTTLKQMRSVLSAMAERNDRFQKDKKMQGETIGKIYGVPPKNLMLFLNILDSTKSEEKTQEEKDAAIRKAMGLSEK